MALVLALTINLLPVTASAAAYSGTCGVYLTWELDTDTGVLTIDGTGAMTNWSPATSVPWGAHKSQIIAINIGEYVSSIGNYAFYFCDNLTSVTIPNSVTSIGENAFSSCRSLTNVTIPNSVTSIGENAFSSCRSLTNVTILDGVTSINYHAFNSCSSLASVTIPNSVTSINGLAFINCYKLTSAGPIGSGCSIEFG